MSKTKGVPVVDLAFDEGIDWGSGLSGHGRASAALLAALEQQVRDSIGGPFSGAGLLLIKSLTGALNGLLGSNYRNEARALAALADRKLTSVLVANMAYDLTAGVGCSTFGTPSEGGVLHARNLDWEFPRRLLQKYAVVARVRKAPRGDYAMVTWPGLFGGLTAVAAGRFSISVNFVQHDAALGAGGLAGRAIAGSWPVPWAVRRVLDEAKDWSSAVKLLMTLPLLTPVLLTVCGTEPGEAVVLECRPGVAHVTRAEVGAPLWITNHYVRSKLKSENVEDVAMDSEARFECLEQQLRRPPSRAEEAFERLDARVLIGAGITQQQVVMSARQGRMWIRVPGRRETVIDL